MTARATNRAPRRSESLSEIPEAYWNEAFENSWHLTGVRDLRRVEAANLNRRLDLARDLLAVFRKHESPSDPLPWPYGKVRAVIRKWTERDRALKDANAERWKGTARARGGESRLAHFVRYLLERYPDLPRSPGPWLRACDRYGSPEPVWSVPEQREAWSPQERAKWSQTRRDLWKPLLRRAGGTKGLRKRFRPR